MRSKTSRSLAAKATFFNLTAASSDGRRPYLARRRLLVIPSASKAAAAVAAKELVIQFDVAGRACG